MKNQPKSREIWSVSLPGKKASSVVLITRPGRLTTSFRMVLDMGIVRNSIEKVKVRYFNPSVAEIQHVGIDKNERTFENRTIKFKALLGELA